MDALLSLLNNNQIDYDIIHHDNKLTRLKKEQYFGIEIGQTTPNLILKTDKGYFSILVSGDHGRVDLASLKDILNVTEIRLAKPNEVEEVIVV